MDTQKLRVENNWTNLFGRNRVEIIEKSDEGKFAKLAQVVSVALSARNSSRKL